MKSREEAVRLIAKLLQEGVGAERKPKTWHFGYVELRELLDFIYGAPPHTDSQKLLRASRLRRQR